MKLKFFVLGALLALSLGHTSVAQPENSANITSTDAAPATAQAGGAATGSIAERGVTPQIQFNATGLQSLTSATVAAARGAVPRNWIRPALKGNGVFGDIELAGKLVKADGMTTALGAPKRVSVTDGHDASYSWGTVQERVVASSNRVTWRVRIENTSAVALQLDSITFLQFLPPTDKTFVNNDNSSPETGLGAVLGGWTATADEKAGSVALVLEQGSGKIQTSTRYYGAYPLRFLPSSPIIAPGESRVIATSLRFGDAGATLETLAPETFQDTLARLPYIVGWQKHGPVNRWFLASAGTHPPTNPNGWYNNDKRIDTTTPEGRTAFGTRLLADAERAVLRNKAMGAQATIVWDPEGQRFGHPISYLGLPLIRDLDGKVTGVSLPPEMTQLYTYGGVEKPLIDHLFATLAKGGETGLTLRHTNALTSAFGLPIYPSHYLESSVVTTYADKIEYAYNRWNCRVYYIDSNPDSAALWRELRAVLTARGLPEMFLIPEWSSALMQGTTTPYRSADNLGQIEQLSLGRSIYPQSWGVIAVSLKNLLDPAQRKRLIAEVRRGSSLFGTAWYDSRENAEIIKIYTEAFPQ